MSCSLVLLASSRVAERMETTTASILIHCSDGWDRTAQLSAISQILLDGYFRTIKGFCTLVDKEWIHMGHKFHDRIGVASKNFKVKKNSKNFQNFFADPLPISNFYLPVGRGKKSSFYSIFGLCTSADLSIPYCF